MIDATAIVLTKNEEKNIIDCIASMRGFAKRVVVVDCGSTDQTVALAKENGADVYVHAYEYYAQQFNWAIDNTGIDTEWIVRLDADEWFPQPLNDEIEALIARSEANVNGITIEADYYFLGKFMKHGLRTKRKMMLFRKQFGRIEDRRRDAHSIIDSGITLSTTHKFTHYDVKSLDVYISRYNWYATCEMRDYLEYQQGQSSHIQTDAAIMRQRKRKFGLYYKAPRYVRAWLWFLYNYLFRLGFLDGVPGFLYCYFECYWYRMLVDAKIYEATLLHAPATRKV